MSANDRIGQIFVGFDPPPRTPWDAAIDRRRRDRGVRAVPAPDAGAIELADPGARVTALVRAAVQRIRQRPITSLAAGLGLGFVIGGALSLRAGRVVLAVAARHVVRELLKRVL